MPNTPIEKAVAAYFSAIRAMDPDAWVATFAPDAVSHDPVGTPPHQGHAALKGFLSGVLGLFETVGLTEQQIFVAGDSAAVKWIGRGVGRNGRSVEFEGIDVIDCNADGKIVLVRAFWDPGPTIAAVTA